MRKKTVILFFLLLIAFLDINAQSPWSLATDFSLIRSQKETQQFWIFGHTIKVDFNITPRSGPYVSGSYFLNGSFHNDLTADAKSTTTAPQSISFRNNSKMDHRHLSIGWKHYLIGQCNKEEGWSLYGTVGFGVSGGDIENTFSPAVDTALYKAPLIYGHTRFKRLTIDAGIGWDMQLSGDIFLYNEFNASIPTTDYPNNYLLANRYVPLLLSVNIGLRVYID